MNGEYTGVVDRIVDGQTAVIIIEEDGEAIDQLTVAVDRLPAQGQAQGGVLTVTVEAGEFVDAEFQPAETKSRRRKMRERLDNLSEKLSEQ